MEVSHLYQAVMLVICVYTLARVMNYMDDTRKLEQKRKAEQERLKKVAALYGREK